MKKCVRFLLHVNSFLQLDFFHNLNKPRPREHRIFPLAILLEDQFVLWDSSSKLGYFLLNYDDPNTRKRMYEKLRSDRRIIPKYHKMSLILKRHIKKAYEYYFNQRHVKNLYENYDTFNINNKIILMKDSYESYLDTYRDIIFLADIFNMRKYLTAISRAKRVSDRLYYFFHSILFNSLNFYKYGMIYGLLINKEYFKEVADELFSIFKLNHHIFSDITFLQTFYLLSRKIESSFNVQRRNDKINFIYFFITPVRFLARYVFPVNNYIKDTVQSAFRRYTTDRLIKYAERSLLDIKRQDMLEEAMKARLELKKINEHPIIK
ncbi:hypothetical protein C922_05859, partial [Plasmodium inui San Antonio 1]